MREVWKRITKDMKAYGGIITILFLVWLVLTLCFGNACITVFITGLPCPGCGMGHALLTLAMGEVEKAHSLNPSVWIWIALGVSFFLYKYVLGKDTKYFGYLLAIVALVSVAIYLYRMVNLFPAKPPLTYFEGNLLQRIYPEYKEWLLGLFE